MILVDTNVWFYHYWRIPLPNPLEARLAKETELALSPVSALEIGIRQRKGKLPGLRPIGEWIEAAVEGYAILPVTPGLAAAAGADAWSNPDPADRLIVWTAKLYDVELLHTDDEIALRTDLKQSFYRR